MSRRRRTCDRVARRTARVLETRRKARPMVCLLIRVHIIRPLDAVSDAEVAGFHSQRERHGLGLRRSHFLDQDGDTTSAPAHKAGCAPKGKGLDEGCGSRRKGRKEKDHAPQRTLRTRSTIATRSKAIHTKGTSVTTPMTTATATPKQLPPITLVNSQPLSGMLCRMRVFKLSSRSGRTLQHPGRWVFSRLLCGHGVRCRCREFRAARRRQRVQTRPAQGLHVFRERPAVLVVRSVGGLTRRSRAVRTDIALRAGDSLRVKTCMQRRSPSPQRRQQWRQTEDYPMRHPCSSQASVSGWFSTRRPNEEGDDHILLQDQVRSMWADVRQGLKETCQQGPSTCPRRCVEHRGGSKLSRRRFCRECGALVDEMPRRRQGAGRR